jgi:hypothetical protein
MRYIELLEDEYDDLLDNLYKTKNKWVKKDSSYYKEIARICKYSAKQGEYKPDIDKRKIEHYIKNNHSDNFLINYGLYDVTDYNDPYFIQNGVTERAFEIKELLDNGYEVNLKNLDVREPKLAASVEAGIYDKIKMHPDGPLHAILANIMNGPAKIAEMNIEGFRSDKLARYATKLLGAGLLTKPANKNSFVKQTDLLTITDLGKRILQYSESNADITREKTYINAIKLIYKSIEYECKRLKNDSPYGTGNILRAFINALDPIKIKKYSVYTKTKVEYEKVINLIHQYLPYATNAVNADIALLNDKELVWWYKLSSHDDAYTSPTKLDVLKNYGFDIKLTPENQQKYNRLFRK